MATKTKRAGVRVSSTRPSAGSTAARSPVTRETQSARQPTKAEMRWTLVDDAARREQDTRDAFAMGALIGGFKAYLSDARDAWNDYDDFAESCFNLADAMMRERTKRGGA